MPYTTNFGYWLHDALKSWRRNRSCAPTGGRPSFLQGAGKTHNLFIITEEGPDGLWASDDVRRKYLKNNALQQLPLVEKVAETGRQEAYFGMMTKVSPRTIEIPTEMP